jgi:hypothetical protein
MGQLVGLWGFNGVLLLGGVITGGAVSAKVMSAGVEMILHERYERSQSSDESVPQPPKVIPLIASALVVVPLLLVALIPALRATGTFVESLRPPQPSVAQPVVEVPTVESPPGVIGIPTIPASTFCSGVERIHPSDTYLCVGSETGDPVGAGRNWVMTAESSVFETIRADSREVMVRFQEGSYPWTLLFGAPKEELLIPGEYVYAKNAAETYYATLEVTSNSAGPRLSCHGRFEVLVFEHGEADVDPDRVDVTRFAADFVQECDGSEANLYGKVRINIPAPDSE